MRSWQGENLTHLTQLLSKYICLIRPCCLWSFRSQGTFFSDSTHHIGFPLSPFSNLVLIHTWLSSHSVYSWTSIKAAFIVYTAGWGRGFLRGISNFLERDKGGLPNFWQTKRGLAIFFSSLSQKRGGLLIFFLHLKKESFFRGFFFNERRPS